MDLLLTRDVFSPTTALSILTVDSKSFGYACEDEDRGLDSAMPLAEIQRRKVRGNTAIPVGRYRVRMTWSNRFKRMLPLLVDVPGFAGIRVHTGNSEADTEGCLLPGLGRDTGKLTVGKSLAAFNWLVPQIEKAERGGQVWITVARAEAPWEAYLTQNPQFRWSA